ncbi:hypothetical protein Micbo1qcDRAFT_223639 [Microdochium bolleyi]|uniref:Fumarylacetoacetase n=1 Tax=Microdochium bolleyi TaxID=196109 RepID=A0A136IJW0_9PEZI|nr:hypothetical protein Micbo1qcDRAFT_223639 [Microdochium bolleyi]
MIRHPFPIPKNSPFPVTNIPFGIFSRNDEHIAHPGVALGDYVLDLQALIRRGMAANETFGSQSTLNDFAALPADLRCTFRRQIQLTVEDSTSVLYSERLAAADDPLAIPRSEVTMHLPMRIGSFTDFMCAHEHVQNVGRLAGYDAVPPNFFEIPLAYNGKASSVIVSGKPVRRPHGIFPSGGPGTTTTPPPLPGYAPTRKLDYEVKMGIFVSRPVEYGTSVPASRARAHIQLYEMTPLGPFNGKSAATSISPWVVTLDALEEAGALGPHLADNPAAAGAGAGGAARSVRSGKDTTVPFLQCSDDISVQVTSYISRDKGRTKEKLATSDLKHLHWSPFQMLAHQSSSGCGLSTGDLVGTGTLSSSAEQAAAAAAETASSAGSSDSERGGERRRRTGRLGCLQEIVMGGAEPVRLSDGSQLTWIEDGDTVLLEGWAGTGDRRIGFGTVSNMVVPAAEDMGF